MTPDINGWTGARLDDLAADVTHIKLTLEQMQSDEVRGLRDELRAAKLRPRAQLTAYLAPLIGGVVPSILIVLFHHS